MKSIWHMKRRPKFVRKLRNSTVLVLDYAYTSLILWDYGLSLYKYLIILKVFIK
jgi:hypothetical protein